MNIIVCVKQVPDTTEVRIDPKTNTLIRQGVPSIVNPYDKYALEAALALRDQVDGKVTVLSMGPVQAQEALRECLAMGADEAILLSDRAFGGADTLATSHTLAAAVSKIGNYDIVFCGMQAIDGDTAQVGPEMAEHLNIPQVTYANKITLQDGKLRIERQLDEGSEVLETSLPVMITATKALKTPRYMTVWGITKAFRQEIPVWTVNDIEVDREVLGLKGSPTQVRKIFVPDRKLQGEIFKGDAKAAAARLIEKLQELKVV
jgi:electron transfer flavoprotein alpha/beta subunit